VYNKHTNNQIKQTNKLTN